MRVQEPLTCAKCQQLSAEAKRARESMAALMRDLENAQTDLIAKRREVAGLKAHITKLTTPPGEGEETVRKIFDYYRLAHDRPRIQLGPKRQKAIRAALSLPLMSPRRVCESIKGYASDHPEARRWRAKGLPVELEYICRDEVTLERGLRWAGVTL